MRILLLERAEFQSQADPIEYLNFFASPVHLLTRGSFQSQADPIEYLNTLMLAPKQLAAIRFNPKLILSSISTLIVIPEGLTAERFNPKLILSSTSTAR